MPFYEVEGHDSHTHKQRTLRISARNDQDAAFTASEHGIVEVKLRPFTDREILTMDLKCFLYADPLAPTKAKTERLTQRYPRSILFDHPILTIAGSILLALSLNRCVDYLITLV